MTRRLLNLLTKLSLLLVVALAALWVRSAYVGDLWRASVPGWGLAVRSDWGRLSFAVLRGAGFDWDLAWHRTEGGYAGTLPGRPTSRRRDWLGVSYVSGTFVYGWHPAGAAAPVTVSGSYRWVQLYHPHALALLLVPAAITLRTRLRQRRRASRGLCRTCGYDLRATPNHCPECGSTSRTGAH